VFLFFHDDLPAGEIFFDTDLGYNKDQLMVITAFPKQWDSVGEARMEAIRNGLLELSVVKMPVFLLMFRSGQHPIKSW
jgi:hypothetical protein